MHYRTLGLILAGGLGAALVTADCSAADRSLQAFSGVWEVSPPNGPGGRRGGEGGPPPGFGRGPGNGSADRQGGPRGPGGFGGPPPGGGPDDDGAELGGPNIEGLDRGDRMTYRQMTPAGKAAFEHMNPRDLPANNCKANGLPSLVGIPDVQEWTFNGDVLTIHYADFDTYRTVYLDGRPASGEPTLLGHSTGTFKDGVLTVTTTNLIATPGGLGRNAPGSATRSYVETYQLADGGKAVRGSVTMHDPEYLTHDLVRPIAFNRAANGVTVPEGVPCDVEASQRYLD